MKYLLISARFKVHKLKFKKKEKLICKILNEEKTRSCISNVKSFRTSFGGSSSVLI